ncbi:MAG: DMT family transporter [Alphaproteobacteria bacterium]|nr:DMT family transporter [Alphaproteobacteria bacterium]
MESSQSKSWYAFVFLLAGMTFFGSATPVSKLVGENFSPLVASTIRMWLAGMVLLPFAFYHNPNFYKLPKALWLRVLGVALVGNIGFSVLMLYGMQMISGVAGSVIMSLTPAVTAIAAVIFLRESLHPRKIIALLIGVSGVLVIQIGTGKQGLKMDSQTFIGSALVFAAICCEAGYTLLGKKATEEISPLSLGCLAALLAGALFIPLAIYDWSNMQWNKVQMEDWAAVAWWGIGTMALGSVLWYSGVQKVPGHIAAGFMAIMPISALFLSYWLLDESFEWIHIPGFALALGGTGLMAWQHSQQMKKET